jgi:hypothetical protein
VFDGTDWVNESLTDTKTIVAGTVDELTDTDITTPANNHFLVFDGTDWVNKSLADTKTILGI